jgi:hypothetical protein
MGLRSGELFNAMCPGRNGPHDLDGVGFNGHVAHRAKYARLAVLEYKRGPVPLLDGTAILMRDTTGKWCQPAEEGGKLRRLEIRWWVIDEHGPRHKLELAAAAAWLWPEEAPALYDRLGLWMPPEVAEDRRALGLEEPPPLVTADRVNADDPWEVF